MRVGATWTWNGNISDPVIDSGGDSVWCPGEPNGDGTCGDSFPCEGLIYANDLGCSHTIGFLCEDTHCIS